MSNKAMNGHTYGIIGLGTMGRNLALNILENEFSVAGLDKNADQVALLKKDTQGQRVLVTTDLNEFVQALEVPRNILLLVPAGKIVDDIIDELTPLLAENDLIADCGNSHFTDTNERTLKLQKNGIHFMGVGVSGGEAGARSGPCIMPGGQPDVYSRLQPMFESIAAQVHNEPCVAWLGNGSAGHYVKMVHNGIEYALMQLIAESYHMLKNISRMDNEDLQMTFREWKEGNLNSFLMEITAEIFSVPDAMSDHRLIDVILDTAHQKGTGSWTSEEAMKLHVPVPVIDIAVAMRDLSAHKNMRTSGQEKLKGPVHASHEHQKEFTARLRHALYFSMITAYAQGLELLRTASDKYGYELNPETIVKIWRGGCIIRSAALDDIRSAFAYDPELQNIMLSEIFAGIISPLQDDIRDVIAAAVKAGVPVPAFMAAISYYDSYRSAWLPANLIQAQRDYFGAHTYERVDREGVFHTEWEEALK